MSDIVDELNQAIAFFQQPPPPTATPPERPIDAILSDARARIITAEADVLGLRHNNEGLSKIQLELEAQNERLREAMDKIVGLTLGAGPCDNGAKIHKIAHDALANG